MSPQTRKIPKPEFSTGGPEYKLRVDRADPVPPGNEYYVSVDIQGRQFEGFVPTSTVIKDSGVAFITGTLVGTIGEQIMISLPPSSMGTATWTMSAEDASRIKAG